MRSLTLVQDIEDASSGWRTEVHGESTEAMEMNVEYELVENAFIDFTMMDLDLEVNMVEFGLFGEDEESLAHKEMDNLMEELRLTGWAGNEVHDDGMMEMMTGSMARSGYDDLCKDTAYYSGGAWWLDRWLDSASISMAKTPASR
jgi:hypothetical protein